MCCKNCVDGCSNCVPTLKTPHIHAALIKAWADGAEIEFYNQLSKVWLPTGEHPDWNLFREYRIKPEPKPDVIREQFVYRTEKGAVCCINTFDGTAIYGGKVRFTFDGETGKLKSVEMI